MAISVGALKVDMAADPSPLINALGQASGAFQKTEADANAFSSVLGSVGMVAGGVVTAGLAVVAAGLAGVSAAAGAALGAWTQLDEAADTLTLKVGATGAALDGLTTSVTAIYNSSAGLQSSMGAIASAMGQVQQITGATGATLEGVTAQFLYLQQAEGQAAGSTETFARAMQSWNVPAEQMSAELDKQYAAFQKTGIGAGELNQALVQFGGQLRQMGLDLNQAEGLLSGMYSAGINTEKALAALSTAAGKFAKDGVDMAIGLRSAIDEIKAVENPTKAAQIAVETFGARAGPALADAIRQGKVSLEGLQATLGDTTGSLKKAVEATMDFPEKLKLMGREIVTALQPAGTAIANNLGKALDEAKPAIDSLAASIGQMAMKVAPLIEGAFAGAKQFLSPLIGAADVLRPSIEQLGAAFGRLGDAIGGAFGLDPGKALSGWNDAVIVAAAWTQVLTDKFTAFVDQVVGEVQPAILVTGAVLSKIGDVLTNNVLPPLGTLLGPLKELNDALFQLSPIGLAVSSVFGGLGDSMGSIDWTRAGKALQATYDTIVLVLGDIIQATANAMQGINITLQQGPAAGLAYFQNSMENLRADHQAKWTAIEAHLQMSMVSTQSSIATGVAGWQSVFGAGLNGMVQEAATAAAQIREQMRLIQLGTQLGNASRGQLDPSMHPELLTQTPAVSNVVPAINSVATNFGNIGKAASAAGGAAAGAKKSAEEMAKQSAETLKAIMDSVEKMKEFLDKGYSALVGDGALAGKITALSEGLFATGRIFVDQLAAAMAGLSENAAKSAELGGQAIGHAASALKSMVELLPKMWDFSKSDAWAAVQSSPALFTQMSATLIDMGRVFFDQMAAASTGIEENSVKAAQLLATGIQASSQAISSVISAVDAMWKMYASGLWDEVQANRALLLQMSQWLIDMGRDIFDQFAAAAQGVSEQSVKAAQLLSTGITVSTQAIGATLKLVQDLLAASFDPSFLDALFGDTRGQIVAIALALIDFGKSVFEAFAAAAAGVKERTVAAAKLLADGVKAAADGLKAASESLLLLLDMANQPTLLTVLGLVGDGRLHDWVLVTADFLARFARDVTERWGAAGMDLGSRVVAAAKRLADGIKAASDGLKATADTLSLLLSLAFVPAAIESIGGVSGTGTRVSAWVLAVAGMLANMALVITMEWGRVGSALGSQVVAAAGRLATGIKSAQEGIKAAGDAVQSLLDLGATMDRLAGVVGSGGLPAWLTTMTGLLGNIALITTDEWGRIGNALSAGASAGADALAKGAASVAAGLRSTADAVGVLLDAGDVLTRLAAAVGGTTLPSWLLNLTGLLGNIALIVTDEWGRIGAALASGATAGADTLAKGVASVASGLASTVAALTTLLDAGKVLGRLAAVGDLTVWLTTITGLLGNAALVMTTEWARIGASLQAGATDAADALAKGVTSASGGITATVTALTSLLDAGKVLARLPQDGSFLGWFTIITSFLANVALLMTAEWGRVGAALQAGAAGAADTLAKGAASVAAGVKSVTDSLTLLTGKDLAKALAALPQNDSFVAWLTGITSFLANVALIMTNEWGRIGAALSAGAVEGVAQLSNGIGSVSSAVSGTITTLRDLADWLKKPVEYTSQIEQAAVTLAQDAAALWVAVANALAKLAPPTEAQTEAVKAWAGLSDFTGQALSMMDTLVKLLDWLKKPAELTPAMTAAAATLAVAWTGVWVAIADALAKIAPPDEDNAAVVKAWSGVSDFSGQALSMMDSIVKLGDWLKKPAELTSAMTSAAGVLAVAWTTLWTAIRDALASIAPPTEDQDANVKAWAGVSDFTSQTVGMMDTLVKLLDWLKKPVDLTLAMRQAAGVLAIEFTQLWWSIWSALKAITPPTETQQANVKAWSQVADFASQAVGMMDTLVKLSDWLKKPVTLTLDMRQAAGVLAVEWTQLWWSIWSALKAIAPPTETQQANVKAWAGVADFASQALSMMDNIVKLSDWLKKPAELTSGMRTAAGVLAVEWTQLWWAIQQALEGITPPTEAEQANVKAWAGISDFMSQTLGMMDTLVKLGDWLKKPSELTAGMKDAATTLAINWTQLWWTIQQALDLMVPPTEAEAANVKAWSGIADFTSQALSMIDTLAKLSDFLKKPAELTAEMKDAAVTLTVNWTQLWWTIQQALELIPPPTEAEQANTKAWAGIADFASQALGMMDTLKKLDDFLKKPLTLTAGMKTAAAGLAVEFTQLWWTIQQALEGITPPTELEQAGVKAWSSVADAFGLIDKTLSAIKSLMEFSFTTGAGDTSVTHTGIPAAAQVEARVKLAIENAVMMLKAIVKAAQDPALTGSLTQAAQDASAALAKVAGDAFTVIGGVLSTVKSLFEFKIESGPGWVQQQGGNNIWSQGGVSSGIPGADAVKAKVDGLMAALKAIVDSVKAGAANINLGADPAALQEKLSTIEAIIASVANMVTSVQTVGGGVGGAAGGASLAQLLVQVGQGIASLFAQISAIPLGGAQAAVDVLQRLLVALTNLAAISTDLAITVAVMVKLPDLSALIASVPIQTISVPVIFDIPDLNAILQNMELSPVIVPVIFSSVGTMPTPPGAPTDSGGGGGGGGGGAGKIVNNTNNINVNLATAAGLPSTLATITNMAAG